VKTVLPRHESRNKGEVECGGEIFVKYAFNRRTGDTRLHADFLKGGIGGEKSHKKNEPHRRAALETLATFQQQVKLENKGRGREEKEKGKKKRVGVDKGSCFVESIFIDISEHPASDKSQKRGRKGRQFVLR